MLLKKLKFWMLKLDGKVLLLSQCVFQLKNYKFVWSEMMQLLLSASERLKMST